ncbi:MAG: peptidylprolyl isomerase [Burkholderiales bacterium RIFOXYC12_FULL_65_23]|uniref:peptidylprolyl isomerase n=1 Tax=Malikia spinosa TaxID=86180 RepID=UPI0008D45EB5|nr:peptidylprolyl isomerase [Malikia spinosa]OGB72996.1 MAG: peptidylprolyl isomerase [Burkholderiales bacterium RIFOXYC12_FULL_65_23]
MHRRTLTRWVAGAALAIAAALPASAQTAGPSAAAQRVKLETSLGVITLELDAQKAPKTVANFVQYVKDKHYDSTVFHRVIDGFMIQGGGFTADMQQKPTRPSIQNEADNGLKNLPLTVAMARTNDPHSASAQFFINVADNRFLNHTQPTLNGWGYAVFGKVVAGADVVDKIRQVRTGNRGMFQDLPTTPVTILKATLEK